MAFDGAAEEELIGVIGKNRRRRNEHVTGYLLEGGSADNFDIRLATKTRRCSEHLDVLPLTITLPMRGSIQNPVSKSM